MVNIYTEHDFQKSWNIKQMLNIYTKHYVQELQHKSDTKYLH